MTEEKVPTVQEVVKRQAELRRIAQRFAARMLRQVSRFEVSELVMGNVIQEAERQAVEDEMLRIIHYLERGRR